MPSTLGSDYSPSEPRVDKVKDVELPTSDLSRILPRQLSTGTMRGTQTVGYGNAKIDGSNNIISVGSPVGTQGIGSVPNTTNTTNEYGFWQTDAAEKIIYKQIQGTQLYYDRLDGYKNSIRLGFAPGDGRPGVWVANSGFDATELLS